MTAREEFEKLKKSVADLQEKHRKQYEEIVSLAQERDRIAADVVREEKLLSGKPFRYAPSRFSEATFTIAMSNGTPHFPEATALLQHDYHGDTPLVWDTEESWLAENKARIEKFAAHGKELKYKKRPVVSIRFDDNDISFIFKNDEVARKFISDFGIQVDLSPITDRQAELRAELDNLDAMLKEAKKSLGEE